MQMNYQPSYYLTTQERPCYRVRPLVERPMVRDPQSTEQLTCMSSISQPQPKRTLRSFLTFILPSGLSGLPLLW